LAAALLDIGLAYAPPAIAAFGVAAASLPRLFADWLFHALFNLSCWKHLVQTQRQCSIQKRPSWVT
jgi:hypothetical protein